MFGVYSNLLSIGIVIDKRFGMFFNSKNVFLMDSKHNVVKKVT